MLAIPSTSWAGCLGRADAASLDSLRLTPGLEAAIVGDMVWLRGGIMDNALGLQLCKLPWRERYGVLDGGRLRRLHSRLPCGFLPNAQWMPLAQVVWPTPPAIAMPAPLSQRVALRLERSWEEREPDVLVIANPAWLAYAESASLSRLTPLRFAQSRHHALVRGRPLPPLPGERFVEVEGVAVPAGFHWFPRVEAALLRGMLGLKEGDLALFRPDGNITRIASDRFVTASRSAVRLSAAVEEVGIP